MDTRRMRKNVLSDFKVKRDGMFLEIMPTHSVFLQSMGILNKFL